MTFPYIRIYNIRPSIIGNTPNAVNWPTIIHNLSGNNANITSLQITGINSSINIEIQPGTGADIILYYRISASQISGALTDIPVSPWLAVTSNTVIAVSNNQWLSFTAWDNAIAEASRIATLVNQSDGNTTLDTFTYISQFS